MNSKTQLDWLDRYKRINLNSSIRMFPTRRREGVDGYFTSGPHGHRVLLWRRHQGLDGTLTLSDDTCWVPSRSVRWSNTPWESWAANHSPGCWHTQRGWRRSTGLRSWSEGECGGNLASDWWRERYTAQWSRSWLTRQSLLQQIGPGQVQGSLCQM